MTPPFLSVTIWPMGLSAALTPAAARLARWLGRSKAGEDTPDKPVVHLGGVAVFVSFAICVLLVTPATRELQGIVLASGLVCILGAIEDVRGTPAFLRLLISAVAVAILARSGLVLKWFPSGEWWGLCAMWALIFLWIAGLVRAFRFLNGLGGLAAGSAAINSFFMGIYGLTTQQASLSIGSFALMGAALGFLPYNYKPFRRRPEAGILLGAGGSAFLGFGLGSITVLGDWVESNPAELLVPALIMAAPMFVMVVTVFTGLRQEGLSRTPAEPAGAHARLQWSHIGIRKQEAVAIIYLVNLCFGISAFLLKGSSTTDASLVLGQMTVIFRIITYAMIVMRKRKGS